MNSSGPSSDDRLKPPDGFAFGYFTNADGHKIRYGRMQAAGALRGSVVITTGYADFIESCFETASEWKKRGFDVYVMDWVEQGGSDRNSAQGPAENARDLHQFRRDIVGADATGPVILSTHSVGAHVGLLCLEKNPKDFDLAVMAAPLVDFQLSERKRKWIRLTLDFAKATRLDRVKIKTGRKMVTKRIVSERSRGGQENSRLDTPKLHLSFNRALKMADPTLAQVRQFFFSTDKINKASFLESIKTPMLMGLAQRDTVADLGAIARAVFLMPGARGVLLNDSSHNVWLESGDVRKGWWSLIDIFLNDFIKPSKPVPSSMSFLPPAQ